MRIVIEENVVYSELRKASYPPIEEQLDMLWHAIDNGTLNESSEFYLKLKEVKEKFPKT